MTLIIGIRRNAKATKGTLCTERIPHRMCKMTKRYSTWWWRVLTKQPIAQLTVYGTYFFPPILSVSTVQRRLCQTISSLSFRSRFAMRIYLLVAFVLKQRM